MRWFRSTAQALALALGAASAMPATAAITFLLDREFSGGTEPAGASPWASATFENASTDHVRLTLDISNLVGTEFLTSFYFNYLPGPLRPLPLAFTRISGDAPVSILQSQDCNVGGCSAFKADGDGYFDVVFNFATSAGARFQAGDAPVIYDIFGTGLTEAHFLLDSLPGGGNGTYYAAAHVQGIGPNGAYSGWIGAPMPIPEPETYAMLLAGLSVFFARALARRRRS